MAKTDKEHAEAIRAALKTFEDTIRSAAAEGIQVSAAVDISHHIQRGYTFPVFRLKIGRPL